MLEIAAKQREAQVEDALRLLLASNHGQQTIVDKDAFVQFLKRCEQAQEIVDIPIPRSRSAASTSCCATAAFKAVCNEQRHRGVDPKPETASSPHRATVL